MPKAKELEQRLERTEQQLRLFQKISRFMVRDMSLQDVLQGHGFAHRRIHRNAIPV